MRQFLKDNLLDPRLLRPLDIERREDADNGDIADIFFFQFLALLSDLCLVEGQDLSGVVWSWSISTAQF